MTFDWRTVARAAVVTLSLTGSIALTAQERATPTISAQPPARDADRELAIQERISTFTGWLVVVGSVVGVLQIGVISAQTVIYARQLKTTKAIERAYVDVRDWNMRDRSDGKKLIVFTLVNTGHTPANIRASLLKWSLSTSFKQDAHYEGDGTVAVDALMLNQSGSSTIAAAFGPLSKPQFDALDRGEAQLFFWGTITYADTFGPPLHHKHFAIACNQHDKVWYAPQGGRNDETDEGQPEG